MNHPIYSAPSTHLPWVTSTVIHQKQRTATKMLKTKLKYSTIRKFRNSALMRMLTFCPKWWKPLLSMRRKIKSIRLIGSYPFGRRWVWKRVWMLSFKIKIVSHSEARRSIKASWLLMKCTRHYSWTSRAKKCFILDRLFWPAQTSSTLYKTTAISQWLQVNHFYKTPTSRKNTLTHNFAKSQKLHSRYSTPLISKTTFTWTF